MVGLVLAGVIAGLATTVAGMGGGLLLVVILTALLDDPVQALVASSPALLVGNTHRAWVYRDQADRNMAWRIAVGAVPAAFAAGLLVAFIPTSWLRILLVAVASLAALRGLGLWKPTLGAAWAAPVGATAGVLHATAGGAGVVLSPYLLARDLAGSPYVATMALCAIALHVTRLAAFGAGGLVDSWTLMVGAGLAASIVLGNAIGVRVSSWIGDTARKRAQIGALLATAGIALVGAF